MIDKQVNFYLHIVELVMFPMLLRASQFLLVPVQWATCLTKTKTMEHCLILQLIVFTIWLVTYSTDYYNSKSKN